MDNIGLLQQCQSLVPLSTLRKPHLKTLIQTAASVTACRGDTLFTESEAPESLFYLLTGEVLLKHLDGTERIITADFHWLPIVQFQCEKFSAMALTDCELLKLNRYHLDNLLTWSQVADYLEIDISYDRQFDTDANWMTSILNSNLFYKIPPLNIFAIYSKISAIDVKKEDWIIHQGDKGDYCYFIKEGKAQVRLSEKVGDSYSVPIAELGIGRCFGEDALIKNALRNASVKMLTDGTLMRLHKSDFKDLLKEMTVEQVEVDTLESCRNQNFQFLDVRTQEEFDYKHIVNAIHIPLTLLRLKIRMLDPQKHYLIYCNTGSRSQATAVLLQQKGYKVSVLKGGLSSINQEQVEKLLVSELDAIYQSASSHH